MLTWISTLLKKEIPILMYHRLIEEKSEEGKHSTYYYRDAFEKQLQYLQEKGYTTITFRELSKLSSKERREKKYIILTFDDGYEDNYTRLFPLLKKYNMKAVIYMVSNLDYNAWDVEKTGEKSFPIMSKEQMLEMHQSGLLEFGGHTQHHVKLDSLSYEEQKKEILENKKDLEKILGIELCSFAYPYGYFDENSKKIAKEIGYRYALATNRGPFYIEEDAFEVRRIGIFSDTTMSQFKRRITGRYNRKKVDRRYGG